MRFADGLEGSSYTNLCATEVLHNTSQADGASLGRGSPREQYIYPVRAHPLTLTSRSAFFARIEWIGVCVVTSPFSVAKFLSGALALGRREYKLGSLQD